MGPEGFSKFWDSCGKTGGAGFAHLNAITGEMLDEASSAQSRPDENKAWKPSKETLKSRDDKTIGISRGEMRALFMGML